MSKVSLYPHIKELKNGKQIPFNELMERIKSDPEFETPINKLRNDYAFGATEAELSAAKNKLPYFTGSGIFSERKDSGLIEHSGKIIIDFDKLESYTTIEAARELLRKDKYTEYIFVSCTGRGLAVVVNITPDPAKHLDSFLFLEEHYKKNYNLIVDKACKDVSRPRYISYDPNLIHNDYFEPVQLIDNSITVDSDEGRFEFALRIHDKKHEYVEGNRHNYLVVLSFWLNKCGVTEEYTTDQLINRFSNADKSPQEITKIITHCYKSVQDFGTFAITKAVKDMPPEAAAAIKAITKIAHGINDAGRMWNDTDIEGMCNKHYLNAEIVKGIFINVFEKNKDAYGIDNKSEIYRIEFFIKKQYEILRNVVTQRTEYRKAGTSDKFEILNTNTIFRKLQMAEFKFTLDKLKSLLRSDFVKEYNPFLDYFNALPEWDNSVDHIDLLANHITTDNQEFWKTQFKKALVRSIACTIGGRENRIVMTLVESEQETGKTSFIRFLCPPQLDDYYTELTMDNSKDTELQLSENFIWNLEELAVLQNNEINKLKSIISRGSVKQRRAYAEFAEKHPRRVNFWASTNRTDFLTDDQNTRWLCFNIINVNHDYNNTITNVKNVDINNVWTQAWHLYKSGFNYNLSKEEKQTRDFVNKKFETVTSDKHLIQTYFTPSLRGVGEFLNSTEIMLRLITLTDNKLTTKLNIISIGKSLKQLGFVQDQRKINGGNSTSRGWWLETKYTELGGQISLRDENILDQMESKIF